MPINLSFVQVFLKTQRNSFILETTDNYKLFVVKIIKVDFAFVRWPRGITNSQTAQLTVKVADFGEFFCLKNIPNIKSREFHQISENLTEESFVDSSELRL